MGFLCLEKNKTKQSYGYGYLKHFDNYLVTSHILSLYNVLFLNQEITKIKDETPGMRNM